MQRDLFDTTLNPITPETPQYRLKGLQNHRLTIRFDHAIVGLIGLVILYVLFFSLGVEKGKKSAVNELNAERTKREQMMAEFRRRVMERGIVPVTAASSSEAARPESVEGQPIQVSFTDLSAQPSPEIPIPAASALAGQPAEAAVSADLSSQYPEGKYTIQLITFNTKSRSDKEIEKLLKQGQKAFVIPSGKFFQICINGYDVKKAAASDLKRLQEKGIAPQDAYIRNLPH